MTLYDLIVVLLVFWLFGSLLYIINRNKKLSRLETGYNIQLEAQSKRLDVITTEYETKIKAYQNSILLAANQVRKVEEQMQKYQIDTANYIILDVEKNAHVNQILVLNKSIDRMLLSIRDLKNASKIKEQTDLYIALIDQKVDEIQHTIEDTWKVFDQNKRGPNNQILIGYTAQVETMRKQLKNIEDEVQVQTMKIFDRNV